MKKSWCIFMFVGLFSLLQCMNMQRMRERSKQTSIIQTVVKDICSIEADLMLNHDPVIDLQYVNYIVTDKGGNPLQLSDAEEVQVCLFPNNLGTQILYGSLLFINIPRALLENKKSGDSVTFYIKNRDAQSDDKKIEVTAVYQKSALALQKTVADSTAA